MLMDQPSDLTGLLAAWTKGEAAAGAALMDAVYEELRRLAGKRLQAERPDHSLSPTALVHEVYLKLVDQRRVQWENRAHFFAIAARLMRRILVDHARARRAVKRGGGATVRLDDVDAPCSGSGDAPADVAPRGARAGSSAAGDDVDMLALDEALEALARLSPRQSQVVELRYFGGLTVEEAAAVLEVSPITVKRDWTLARTWLFRELRGRPS